MSEKAVHRVARGGTLVLGGGFAGAQVARRLGRAGATIGARTPTCCSAARPTSTPHRRTVSIDSEAGRFIVSYSDLVIALGSVTRMPALPGLAEHALGLKDLGDAIRLRNHVLRQIELATRIPTRRRSG